MNAEEQRAFVEAAARAYVYGYPLVYSMGEAAGFVAGSPRFPTQAPYNHYGHVTELAGPDFKFVSPNSDTLYSIAVCDVRDDPLVVHVPDTGGRYYVLQFIDAWTNNFAYIGRRVRQRAGSARPCGCISRSSRCSTARSSSLRSRRSTSHGQAGGFGEGAERPGDAHA